MVKITVDSNTTDQQFMKHFSSILLIFPIKIFVFLLPTTCSAKGVMKLKHFGGCFLISIRFASVEVPTSKTTPFFTVVAFDLDLVETSITYSIAEQSENKDNFELDSSNGELTGKNLNDLLNNVSANYLFQQV